MNKVFTSKTKAAGDRIIEFIISDETIDRDNEIMKADGCDFTEFANNPLFLRFHNGGEYPAGKAISWSVDPRAKNITMKIYFPTLEELASDPSNAAEKAKEIDFIYNMYKLKMMNAVSIGFKTIESEMNESGIRVITKWQLLEVSAVPIPANPNALQKALKSGELSTESVKWLTEKTNELKAAMDMDAKAGRTISKETHAKLSEMHKAFNAAHKAMGEALECHAEFLKTGAPIVGDEIGSDVNEQQPEKDYVIDIEMDSVKTKTKGV